MLPLDTVLTFFVTALMLALAPGPDIIFVLTQSAPVSYTHLTLPTTERV